VLDVEAYSNNNIWDNKMDHMDRFINTFITEMKKNGHDIIIYSYRSFIDDNTDHIFGDYPLWLASYLNDPEHYTPTLPSGWSEWKIWQFTEKGRIDGYDGDIDLDVMKNEYFNQF
jgi:lysozyme